MKLIKLNEDKSLKDYEKEWEEIKGYKTCDECGTRLNDKGTCPKCDEGEEDLKESGNESEEFKSYKAAIERHKANDNKSELENVIMSAHKDLNSETRLTGPEFNKLCDLANLPDHKIDTNEAYSSSSFNRSTNIDEVQDNLNPVQEGSFFSRKKKATGEDLQLIGGKDSFKKYVEAAAEQGYKFIKDGRIEGSVEDFWKVHDENTPGTSFECDFDPDTETVYYSRRKQTLLSSMSNETGSEDLKEDIKQGLQKYLSLIPKDIKPAPPVAKNGKCGGCDAQLPAPDANGLSVCTHCGGMYAGETFVFCPSCGGAHVDPKNDFKCKKCGSTLTSLSKNPCPSCGGILDPKTNKCKNCGSVIKKPIPEGMTTEQPLEEMEESADNSIVETDTDIADKILSYLNKEEAKLPPSIQQNYEPVDVSKFPKDTVAYIVLDWLNNKFASDKLTEKVTGNIAEEVHNILLQFIEDDDMISAWNDGETVKKAVKDRLVNDGIIDGNDAEADSIIDAEMHKDSIRDMVYAVRVDLGLDENMSNGDTLIEGKQEFYLIEIVPGPNGEKDHEKYVFSTLDEMKAHVKEMGLKEEDIDSCGGCEIKQLFEACSLKENNDEANISISGIHRKASSTIDEDDVVTESTMVDYDDDFDLEFYN